MQNKTKTKTIAAPSAASRAAAILGARGRGAAKRRAVDYAALAAKSHAARRKNRDAKTG